MHEETRQDISKTTRAKNNVVNNNTVQNIHKKLLFIVHL